jgi:hypothetical protein
MCSAIQNQFVLIASNDLFSLPHNPCHNNATNLSANNMNYCSFKKRKEWFNKGISKLLVSDLLLSGTIIRGTLKAPNSQLVTPISIKL